ncbi:cytochrome P450 [Circinella umbellata]|nr:cytochrome P450 [Circinella umbellata]
MALTQQNDHFFITTTVGIIGSITTIGLIGSLIYKYPDRAIFDHVQKGIPHVKGYPLVGTFFEQVIDMELFYDKQQKDKFESLNTMTMINSAIGIPLTITTIDPNSVQHILTTNFPNYVKGPFVEHFLQRLFGHGIFVADGKKWYYQRKTTSRIFNVVNLRDIFTRVFVEKLEITTEQVLDQHVINRTPLDIQDLLFKFTLDSFVQIGFGKNLNTVTHKGIIPFAESFDMCQRHCNDLLLNPFTPIVQVFHTLLHPRTKSINDHYKIVDQFAYDVIAQRRKDIENGQTFNDLLSYFMKAQNEKQVTVDDIELRDMILNLIIAGRDTTACTLSWTLYMLMLHPRIEYKLLKEIDQFLPRKAGEEENSMDSSELYKIVKNMIYCHAVLYEVLRLYPPVPSNVKMALEDDIWPDGSHIRKGNMIVWSSYAQARSAKVWGEDCQEFKPERWITMDGQLRHESQGKWPVFNGGPRVCIGQSLATLEAIIVMITLIRKYKFSLLPNQKIEYFMSLTMPIKNGLKVFVENR